MKFQKEAMVKYLELFSDAYWGTERLQKLKQEKRRLRIKKVDLCNLNCFYGTNQKNLAGTRVQYTQNILTVTFYLGSP